MKFVHSRGPFLFLFFHLAFVLRLLLSFQIFERLARVVLLTNDSELVLEVTCVDIKVSRRVHAES